VFQRIDVVSCDFDNIVELELGAPWPLPPLEATATLAHKFEIIGASVSHHHQSRPSSALLCSALFSLCLNSDDGGH